MLTREIINEDVETEEVTTAEENTQEEDVRPKKSVKKKILIAVEILLGAALLALAGFFVYSKFFAPKPAPVNPTSGMTVRDELLTKEQDEDILSMYQFVLYGDYVGTEVTNHDEQYEFCFRSDSNYFGYSSFEADDCGTYALTSENGKYKLNIEFANVTDNYDVEFSDTGAITLKNDEHTFNLSAKE